MRRRQQRQFPRHQLDVMASPGIIACPTTRPGHRKRDYISNSPQSTHIRQKTPPEFSLGPPNQFYKNKKRKQLMISSTSFWYHNDVRSYCPISISVNQNPKNDLSNWILNSNEKKNLADVMAPAGGTTLEPAAVRSFCVCVSACVCVSSIYIYLDSS